MGLLAVSVERLLKETGRTSGFRDRRWGAVGL